MAAGQGTQPVFGFQLQPVLGQDGNQGIKMEEDQKFGTVVGMKPEEQEEEEENVAYTRHGGNIREYLPRLMGQQVKQEPGERLVQHWEDQWQGFLKAIESPRSIGEKPPLAEDSAPWSDVQAFLASFEQVAKACLWPQGEWVVRLRPALRGEAGEVFSGLEARDREDYGKVKAALLQREALRRETIRRRFRSFCYCETEGPRAVYGRLRELCYGWLKAERQTKEQILEELILEQFLVVLPTEVQNWVRSHGPESCARAVALAEDYYLGRECKSERLEQQVSAEGVHFPGVEQPLLDSEQDRIFHEAGRGVATFWGDDPPGIDERDHPERVYEEAAKSGLPVPVKEVNLNVSIAEQMPSDCKQKQVFWEEDPEVEGSLSEALLSANERNHPEVVGKEAVRLIGMGTTEEEDSQCGATEDASRGWHGPKEHQRGSPQGNVGSLILCSGKEPLGETASQQRIQVESGRVNEGSYPENSEVTEFQVSHIGELPYKCLDCKKSFSYNTSLVRHQRSHTGEKSYTCLDCGKTFCQSSGLAVHQKIHTGEKAYQCPDCGKSFRVKAHLIRHSIIHKGKKPYKCEECGVSCCDRSELRIHQRIHTGEKPYHCADCGKNFCRKADLTLHQRIHTGEMPYKCLECGKSFRWSSSLITHQKTHTGVKPFECAECGKSYYSSMSLVRHQRVHTGGTPYICSNCGKGFCDSTSLTRHQMIHTGEKPYVCMDCGKSFNRNSNLISHQRIHTGVKPFLCADCGKNFRSKSELQRHYIVHVGEKSSPKGGDPEVPPCEKTDGDQPINQE